MSLSVIGFIWDAGNREKCTKHGLSILEIEDFFSRGHFSIAPDDKHSKQERRLLAIGRAANGKPVFIVFIERRGLIRPVSARYMHDKELKRYEEKSSAFQNG